MNLRRLVTLIAIATLTTTTWCAAQSAKESSFFDNVWQFATLYDNTNNRSLQKLALAGRLQIDAAWVDADDDVLEGFTDLLWRRFSFGFKSEWFRDWATNIMNFTLASMFSSMTINSNGRPACNTLVWKTNLPMVAISMAGA